MKYEIKKATACTVRGCRLPGVYKISGKRHCFAHFYHEAHKRHDVQPAKEQAA